MRIGNKIFPYPTLNQNKDLSEYKESSSFELNLTTNDGELIKDEDRIILKDVHFQIENDELEELFYEEKLKCALIVECSPSLYRKSYLIDDFPSDIDIPLEYLKDRVNISAHMYANEKISNYMNKDFNEEYEEYKFNLEKYNIVAIDDGYSFRVDIDDEEDNKATSIFTIIRLDSRSHIFNYENGSDKINLILPIDYYKMYNSIKDTKEANNIVFGLLLVPVLSKCLDEIRIIFEDAEDVEEIIEEKRWFKSICKSYEKVFDLKLTIDEFRDINTYELAQKLLNNGTSQGLRDFSDMLYRGMQDGENNGE